MLKVQTKKINFINEPKKDQSQPESIYKTRDSSHEAGTNPIKGEEKKE